MVLTALTSNVGGPRLERGLGVTVICTSLPSKSRNPTNRSTEKSVSRLVTQPRAFLATSWRHYEGADGKAGRCNISLP